MTELTHARLLIALLLLAVVGGWLLARRTAQRRRTRFLALAAAMGGEARIDSEFALHFATAVDGRAIEVGCRHLGSGMGASNAAAGWYLVTRTPLRGVSALHSADVCPRSRRSSDAPPSADDFVVRDAGYPLPDGWLTPAVAAALRAFYATAMPRERLWIEEGALIHRSRVLLDRADAPALRDLLQRQVAVAVALEKVL